MKLNLTSLAFALTLPVMGIAQIDSTATQAAEEAVQAAQYDAGPIYDSLSNTQVEEYPNTFSSGSANVSRFTNQSKRFNDWSISIGAGTPLFTRADLTSIKNGNGKNMFGYSAYLSVDKAITHAFGLKLQYDRGETRQGWFNTKDPVPAGGGIAGRTQFDAISILGDINFTSLFRRVDNMSPYRWGIHGYAGVGVMGYKAYQKSADYGGKQMLMTDQELGLSSFFGQLGAGIKFKVSRRIDIEGRVMYLISGDDEYDGGGDGGSRVNRIEEQVSDNLVNVQLGLTFKLGKHDSHLYWHDPLQEIYYKLDVLNNKETDVEVCKSGDADNDGVCDDWDRELNTPAGARVDGAGVALDVDLDGVIDLYDECVTVPGPVENKGCPIVPTNTGSGVVVTTDYIEGIEFDLNSYKILPSNNSILNNAVNYINKADGGFKVVGATDTRGTYEYNQKLSERRANAVKNFLIKNGVQSTKLVSEGRGKKDLKYPECEDWRKCPEWKNRANRRVFFEAK